MGRSAGRAASAQAADTLGKIAQSGKITLAYRESSVPFSYLNGPSQPIGFSVEPANAVVESVKKKLGKPGLEVAWMPVTARAKEVSFAVNHFYTGTRLLAKKSSRVKDYADLAKKTVASTTGTTNAQVMRKYNSDKGLDMDIVLAKDHADAFLLVESGRAVAFAMDDILLFGLMSNAKAPAEFEVVGEALQVEPYACMLPKDDAAFKQVMDDTIVGLMKSGEFEKMYTKWFIAPIPPKNAPLGLPMSPQLRDSIKTPSDKPAT